MEDLKREERDNFIYHRFNCSKQNRISTSNQISILSLRNKINLQQTRNHEERVRVSIQYGGAIFSFISLATSSFLV